MVLWLTYSPVSSNSSSQYSANVASLCFSKSAINWALCSITALNDPPCLRGTLFWEHPSYAKTCKSEKMKGLSHLSTLINSEKAQLIQHHAEAIAALLYEDTSPEQVKTLESIEKTVIEKVLEHVTPTIAVFLSA